MTALDRVRDALTARNCPPRGNAARCPAHDDHDPSLSIGPAQEFAGVLLKCHGGCHVDDILAALELTRSDLFDEPRQAKQGQAVVAEYPYVDEAGTVLYIKQRLWPKTFRQYVPTPSGGKEWSLNGVRRVLYRLPEIIAAITDGQPIYVVEGEKDADALTAAGVTATCNTEGAAKSGQTPKWRCEYTEQLRGAHITVIADKDEAGRAHANHIAKQLTGTATSIRLVEAKEGKDATDHLNAGHSVEEFFEAAENKEQTTAKQRPEGLAQLLTQLRTWQDLPDPVHVVAALAAAATRKLKGEPCWLLLVAPPSSGKTEGVRLLDDIADARLDEVTAAGLLSWSKGAKPRRTGILTRIGEQALVTFGDLSSLLATSDRGGRDQVFGLLRKAYDGHVVRDIASPTPNERLEWAGRLTVVACVTGIIDRYAAHADQLGPRWLQVRIPERSTEAKRKAAKQARRKELDEHRQRARENVANLLNALPDELPDLPDTIWDDIEDAALVAAWGRGAVPRNGYGKREIEGMPIVEEPMRLVQQLGALARGVRALGLPDAAVPAIIRRVALDSMPEARRAVLQALATGQLLSTSKCGRDAKLHRHVARMALEDLAAIGVVENDRPDHDSDNYDGAVNWTLAGEDGVIIAGVFKAFHQTQRGWHETWVHTSTSPQTRERERHLTR